MAGKSPNQMVSVAMFDYQRVYLDPQKKPKNGGFAIVKWDFYMLIINFLRYFTWSNGPSIMGLHGF